MTQAKAEARFTRRSFIKGAAALTATGALAGCTPVADNLAETGDAASLQESPDEIFSGVCRGDCFGGCFLSLHVRDGKLVRTSMREFPDASYNRICSKGLSHPERVYSSKRLQYPMKRIGERGEGKFERISWDEAIETIATTWRGFAEEYGAESMAVFYGGGCAGSIGGGMWGSALSRFIAATGCSTVMQAVDMAMGYGMGRALGSGSSFAYQNEPTDWKNSKTIICWGSNPFMSMPQVGHFILEAKEAGTKYIVIDPVFNFNAAKADQYIYVNPATDGALALGITGRIIAEQSYDDNFLKHHSEAAFLIKEDGSQLRLSDLGVDPEQNGVDPDTGEPVIVDPFVVWDESTSSAVALEDAVDPAIEGVESVKGIPVKTQFDQLKELTASYTLERTEELTGVPVDTIKELARIYAEEGPVNTLWAVGPDHYNNGAYNYWCMTLPALMTGQIGKPGAAVGAMSSMELGNIVNATQGAFPVDDDGTVLYGSGTIVNLNNIGSILDSGVITGTEVPLKGCYICFTNPVSVNTNRAYTIDWIKKLEFVVVADITMTETAKYADILLPVCHWFECTELFGTYITHPYAILQKPVLERMYESKSDFEIYKMILEQLNLGKFLDMTEEEYMSMLLDNDTCRERGVTVEALSENGAVRVFGQSEHIAMEGAVFATSTGRASFYQEAVALGYDIGQEVDETKEKVPYWEPAKEADINSAIREKYPFVVITENMRTRTHSEWWDVESLKEYEPGPFVRVSVDDAKELDVAEGDMVRLYNDRGALVLPVVINPGLPKGIVTGPRAYQIEEHIDGGWNDITSHEFNQACENMVFYDVAVAIEKINEEA
ncbi:molybdopterin-dependent oxidoreductase [Adlercreutzia sp. R25]|uniref:Molybdopterin-dependent oxidoreductase n=1 Tax=Adlercreutzia shanghongiae TaxID=3111773 RepID=A0ABU6J023_9ACTN|nr:MULTISPECIES: molybdopterin-dependent oxidoreductase [unclassified Adlercreutzia]MEC4273158.1 molybdopterin-dependent oxidoreductase [Adlercreutzia sp. R25]MEC4295358.1 molybdopterin-dependent oxidoreductase [Adlercreutzia sp. R22]